MSNRSKILSFCKRKQLEVVSLEWNRYRTHVYGDPYDSSHWLLVIRLNGREERYDTEDDSVKTGIERMFTEIENDIGEL